MEQSFRKRLIQLHHCRGIGWKTLDKMLKLDPTLRKIFAYTPKDLYLHFQIPLKRAETIVYDLQTVQRKNLLQWYKERNIQTITRFDDNYPFLLKQIYQPPFVLYYLGDGHLLKEKRMISIVGTRNPSEYGKRVTEQLVKGLVERNYVIISGFAKGIDGLTHLKADQFDGKTIAVLGSGLFHIYPKDHRNLFQILSKKHLILSEYPPNKRPEKYHFPERNRIIAGLSLGTLVIEAKERSGSLITANIALQEGREVFAVPGPITSATSKGTNLLIQQGAKLVLSVEDITNELKNME
ncbi:DNA-processing protein DprA [Fervidibacillus halotolerans]|uniref:DNA-processing protein DprA n=1 Tax=Fervidibacillus halotolerans TaxID=2980027 RepID=A0A9E8M166_9BACI|nr:DNA-processing protein DprA [Fervidibacillus halotolerans]WAA13613.1 DNA-processing protein DprA [Fervidibacillus halotolerans]